jgi:hypothetical protein
LKGIVAHGSVLAWAHAPDRVEGRLKGEKRIQYVACQVNGTIEIGCKLGLRPCYKQHTHNPSHGVRNEKPRKSQVEKEEEGKKNHSVVGKKNTQGKEFTHYFRFRTTFVRLPAFFPSFLLCH